MRSFAITALVLAVSVASVFNPSMLTRQLLHPKGFTSVGNTSSPSNSTDSE